MATVCPTCASPIDPARAPLARVRGTHVLTFCSLECANAPGPRPVAPGAEDEPAPARPPPAPAELEAPSVAARAAAPRRDRRRVIALLSAILVGGMVAAIVDGVSPSRSTPASAASDAVPGPEENALEVAAAPAAPAEAPDELDPDRLLERARAELRALLGSSSPRLQRVAAMALARQRDPEALARLRTLLDEESSELIKIDIAHALASAGDEAGEPALLGGLSAKRRDVRVDAARALARLGDDRGAKVLQSLLSYRHFQISAAAVLAERGDDKGLALLKKQVAGDARTDEQRMRALVALGRAGDTSVRDELLAVLDDRTHRVGAAEALAALGEAGAVPALLEQLEHPSLRVGAALALRRMEIEVELEPLALALVSGGDVARVSAAEAILILLGDAQVAERD